ncbi:MAG TPA: tetratricopeptide repeat protein [Steroidobacteraceae bacterium]|nr:tetratricopeptide repeat protein [Steroidobacteraceae bacterium]
MIPVRAAALSILILPLILLTGCTGAEARRQSYIERGQTYLAQGDYTRASIEFRNAMQVSPKDPQARLLAGEAAERLGRYRDAAGLFQSVVESNPDNVQARVDLGQIFDFGAVPQRALTLIKPALATHPNDPGLLTVRALARSQLGDYAGALADAKHAVQADPTYEQAIGLLAGLYRQKGDQADAAALVSASLRKLPHSTELREVLASIYEQAGDDTKAEAQLDQLIAARPQALQYRAQLAQLYAREGKLDQAEDTLRAAVKAAPQSDDAKLAMADFIASHRAPAQGEMALQSFIGADPDDSRLRLALGALFERSGAAQQALQTYEEIVQRDVDGPDALAARDRIAAIDLSQGRNEAAADEVAKVLAKDPGNDAALIIRGNFDLAAGQPTAAVTDLRAVLRDEPGLVAVHGLLARALLASGDTALAEDQLQAVIQSAPEDSATRLELAQIYTRAHAPDRAVTVLEQGVQQLPSNGPLREALVRAYLATGDFKSAGAQADSMTAALPHSGAGPYLEGLIALAQKRYAPAESDFEEALARQPRAMAPLLDLTRLELSRHEDAKASKRLQAMVQNDPKDGLAQELLGELDLTQKAYPQAIDAFSRAVSVAPSLWFGYRNLAVARMANGDAAGAIAAYQAGIKAAPNQPELVTELASCYIVQGQPDGAISLYESLYRSDPRSPATASNLALLLATYRTDRQSLDRARQLTAAFATSQDGALLDSNGWALLKTGDLQHALPELRRAAGQNPASGLFRYHLAIAELQAGERTQAQADLKAALSGSSAFPGVVDARSKLASLQSGA